MRILWVSPTLSRRFGGPSTTTSNGLRAERRAGLDSEIVSTVGPDEAVESLSVVSELREDGVPVTLFRRWRTGYRLEAWGFSPPLAIWLIRNAGRYDVLHLQYVWCLTSLAAIIGARARGTPVVVTPHESLTEYDIQVASRSAPFRLAKLALRRLYCSLSDRLIFMSELEERGTPSGASPSRLIRHAVRDDFPSPRHPAARGLVDPDGEGLRIAFLGRMVEKKGLHSLIEAVARHPEKNRRLLVAGPPSPGDYRERLERRVADLGIADRVEFLGHVPNVAEMLRDCDVLAMPSAYEGFGMVAAEAMSLGMPVVVPRQSGIAELVEEFGSGVIVRTPSVEELDGALCRFEDCPELLGEMGQRGLEAVEMRLTYSLFASEITGLYRELLPPGPARRAASTTAEAEPPERGWS